MRTIDSIYGIICNVPYIGKFLCENLCIILLSLILIVGGHHEIS